MPHWERRADEHAVSGALLAIRLVVGGFLLWSVADNLASSARMAEFAAFLAAHDFPWPAAMARLSVYAQALCGIAFIVGWGTRIAGIVCAINFLVALVMVDLQLGVRGAYPSASLVLFGLLLAARGPGRWSLDALPKRRRPLR